MKNLLFVSIAFPPKLDPECIQVAKYVKYLLKSGKFNIDVVTSASPTLFMPDDLDFKSFYSGVRQQIKIKIFENKYLNAFLRKFFFLPLLFPDTKFTFHLQWKKVIRNLNYKPSMIYSRSFPISSSIMAYKLKKHYNVPWIMHLSDPWVETLLYNYTSFEKKKHNKWELKCFNEAEYICFTSIQTIKLYTDKYPNLKNKFKFFPNVYDKKNINQRPKIITERLRFVYTGGLDSNRSPKPILKAIQSIKKSNPELLKKCDFIFSGEVSRKNKILLDDAKNIFLTYLGPLSYKESIKLQHSAHILIMLDSISSTKDTSIMFLSKLLDYLVAGKKILAVTPNNSTSRVFIEEQKLGSCFTENDSIAIKNYLIECITQFKHKNYTFFCHNIMVKEYEAAFNVKKLISLFHEVI